jgi:hypothetical protein
LRSSVSAVASKPPLQRSEWKPKPRFDAEAALASLIAEFCNKICHELTLARMIFGHTAPQVDEELTQNATQMKFACG